MTTDALLAVDGLHAHYGRAHILTDLSLEVGAGEVVALLGRNGAGKSTTLKSVMGLVRPSAGSVRLAGFEIAGSPSHAICRRGIGYVPEERRIFAGLTVMENLEVGRQPSRSGLAPWTAERLFEIFPNLDESRDRSAGSLSGGEQQMLSIARTLMGNPPLLLLDEPSEGLAPVIVDQMAETISALQADGVAVLLCEQNLGFAMRLASRAYIIEKGRIPYAGSIEELRVNDEIRDAYLTV